MNRALLKKSMVEARVLLIACVAAMYSFCWARVWIISQFSMGQFENVLEQFREYERFSPVPFEQLFTYTGRVALTYDEPIVVVCVSLWAIARGTDCISGEIGRGTMEMLLAQPVSRLQVLWSQASVTLVGVAILAFTSWLGLYTGVMTNSVEEPVVRSWTIPWLQIEVPNPLAEKTTQRTPLWEKVDPADFAPAAVNLFALGVFFAGFSSLLSSLDRYRWRTIGLVVGFYIFQTIIKVLGLASDRLDWLRRCTIFTAYEPERFVSIAVGSPESTWSLVLRDGAGRWMDLGPLGYDLLLIGMGAVAYLAATVIFQRRDLPAPL
ncbi:MAG: ABC transporter permease [Planctomycetes bacterium]|nr:ABC transporter permease [Planctomycetota bacterium]